MKLDYSMITFDSEKDMEDMFVNDFEHFSEYFYAESAFRQVRLGAYGTCDVLYVSMDVEPTPEKEIKAISINLIELKNTKLKETHISQCARYKRFFDGLISKSNIDISVEYFLIGLKTLPDSSDFCFLAQSIDWLQVYEIEINPSVGIELGEIAGWRKGDDSDSDIADVLAKITGGKLSGED